MYSGQNSVPNNGRPGQTGKVRACDGQGQDVAIDVEQNRDKVSIRIGATGDTATSRQVVAPIKSHLNWL
jgi:hypothetical protein